MDWLKTLLPLAESGLKLYLSGKMVQKSAERAKEVAIRGSVIFMGFIAFFIFFVASVLMVFVDLGVQFESQNGVHFSGMMMSALYLTSLGLVILTGCYLATKIMEKREEKNKTVPPVEKHPYASLILFGEEFLKTLVHQLNQNQQNSRQKSNHANENPR